MRKWPTLARVRPITARLRDAYHGLERLRRDCDRLIAAMEGSLSPDSRPMTDVAEPTLEDVGALAVVVDHVEAYLDQLADEIAKVRMAMSQATAFVPLPARETQGGDAA
jgi:hypothetical protein